MISVNINNKTKEIQPDTSLEQLILVIRDTDKGIAVAINNNVVNRSSWNDIILEQDDNILVIQATQGG